RAARRARVLAAVASDPAATPAPAARRAWEPGGWLAAASVAGLSALLAVHVYTPAPIQPPTAPTPVPAAAEPRTAPQPPPAAQPPGQAAKPAPRGVAAAAPPGAPFAGVLPPAPAPAQVSRAPAEPAPPAPPPPAAPA